MDDVNVFKGGWRVFPFEDADVVVGWCDGGELAGGDDGGHEGEGVEEGAVHGGEDGAEAEFVGDKDPHAGDVVGGWCY